MKSWAIILTGLWLVTAVAVPSENTAASSESVQAPELSLLDRPPAGHSHSVNGEGVPQGVFLEPEIVPGKPATPEGKVSVIKYGPYTIGAMSSVENRPVLNMQKPCSSCYIVAIQADLKYADGRSANINEGGWLHHMVMYNNGAGRRDAVCNTMLTPQRIFASGNERTVVRTNGKYKYGIEFGPSDSMGMIYDLMNESKTRQTWYIEMSYEWVPMGTAGYQAARMAWLDITGCGAGDYPARAGVYEVKSRPWKATFSGKLLSATGHEHDGGTDTVIYKNGQAICTSAQLYGRRPAWVGGMEGMPMPHISDTGTCADFGSISAGDSLVLGAKYNTSAHPLNKNMKGIGNAPIMGISQIYIG